MLRLHENPAHPLRIRTACGFPKGGSWLVTHFQLGRDTVRAAMALLEQEGVLVSDGQGRPRRIAMNREDFKPRNIRVTFFLYQMHDRGDIDNSTLLAELLEAGIDAKFSTKSLKDLGMDVERVAQYVKKNPADAWIISAGSREVLEWFAGQPTPVIAMYGRFEGLPIAAAHTLMILGQTAAVRRLIELGHKRIVMVTREERRKPILSRPEQAFIDELEAAGIKTGEYNIPDWEETREGLSRLLDELFRFSPPTALFFQEAQIYTAARYHLADRGIVSPRKVSLIVADRDPSFAWCDPIPAHIDWDYRPVVRHIVRWAKNLAHGKHDRRVYATSSEFIEGGTIGPVPNPA
jgi:DNA-binding LacI/PurR family transcriptional regulator